MATEETTVLIFADPVGDDLIPDLPVRSNNIFQRVIRNPRPETPHARERECSEMLTSVLLNAPSLRNHLFQWMACQSGLDPNKIDIETLKIETERYICAKRVDMCIEGEGHATNDKVERACQACGVSDLQERGHSLTC